MLVPHHKLMRGFDDTFTLPHSRHTGIDEEALKRCRGLEVLAVSEIAGSCVICSRNGRQVFVTGHAEYDRDTLAKEYFRDKNKDSIRMFPTIIFRMTMRQKLRR